MPQVCIACLLLLGISTTAQDTIHTFVVGDTLVKLVEYESTAPGPLFFNMHDDENTSVEAAKEVLKKSGGKLYELVHGGVRNIAFHVDTLNYDVDPNRIYTNAGIWLQVKSEFLRDSVQRADRLRLKLDSLLRVGIQPDASMFRYLSDSAREVLTINSSLDSRNLSHLKRDSTFALDTIPAYRFTADDSIAFRILRGFADSLLTLLQIDSQNLVIALHNNKEEGYSMASYLVDSIYQNEAQAVYIGMHPDPDDFYFVTERRLFEALQPNHFHIVLQDNTHVTDDGSLSVYCGKRGIHYVNVEAQHEHLKDQRMMLKILLKRLGY